MALTWVSAISFSLYGVLRFCIPLKSIGLEPNLHTSSLQTNLFFSSTQFCRFGIWAVALYCLGWGCQISAVEVYEAPDAFVDRQFDGTPPKPVMLYPTAPLKKQIKSVLGHRYAKFRIRYWLKENRSVWILEEIGKERPITTGFAIAPNGIEEMKVLVFRESRGWEVRYDSFARQFTGGKLIGASKLNKRIDNITGATLSVNAVTRLARLALVLHGVVIRP